MPLEPVHRPVAGADEVASSFSASHFVNAVIALVFAALAPVAIIASGCGMVSLITAAFGSVANWLLERDDLTAPADEA